MARKKNRNVVTKGQIVEMEGHYVAFVTDDEGRIYAVGNFSTEKDAWWACNMASQAAQLVPFKSTVDEFCEKIGDTYERLMKEKNGKSEESHFSNIINFEDLRKK